ncbi:MAG: D-alanyl-D-alanine carboxypeptidase [Oscillospiraceae bacterium]|nr:D-alanyl-D-alanine carboxypeptidase [Oscillospiraceae bacterium]
MKKLCTAAGFLAAVLFWTTAAFAAPQPAAHSAILLDADTGSVLFAQNEHDRSLIASTTKIMTGYLAAQYGALQKTVTVPPEAVGVEGSSLYLKAGETVTREMLLYGLMLQSGNDAAAALAIDCAGSLDAFVRQMNDTAQKLGLTDTHYGNPHGLDAEGNYSTAYDLAVLTAHALQNETFRTVVASKYAAFETRTFANHNKLLWRYDGAIGVKTGFTKKAGRILVSAAMRGGRTLIAVTINDSRDWQDHAAMLDYGFSRYQSTVLLRADQPIAVAANGAILFASAPQDVVFPLAENEQIKISYLLPKNVYSARKGKTAGFAVLTLDGTAIAATPLVWCSDYESLRR